MDLVFPDIFIAKKKEMKIKIEYPCIEIAMVDLADYINISLS